METEIIQLGALGIVLCLSISLSIKEFFSYLKTKKNGNGNNSNKEIVETLKAQNENHLTHINDSIGAVCNRLEDGDTKVVEAISNMHRDLSGQLKEMNGFLKGINNK